jgi:hypothetical protein
MRQVDSKNVTKNVRCQSACGTIYSRLLSSMSGTAIRASPVLSRRRGRPFHELPNVLMTPHIAGWTDDMLEARGRLIAEKRAARRVP